MKVGKVIADLRKEKAWSQADLANKTGISQVMVGKYERGDATPSLEVAKKIADAFKVSLDYLAGEGKNASFDQEMIKRLENIEELPQEEKDRIFYFIDLVVRDHKTSKAYETKR